MPNIAQTVWAHAAERPDDVALRSVTTSWSWSELRGKVAAYAGLLSGRGIGPGARFVLLAPSEPEFVVAYLAGQAIGAVVVSVNTMATPRELTYVTEDSGAAGFVAWHRTADAARATAEQLGGWFEELTSGADVDAEPIDRPLDRPGDDTATLLYTSGTTGLPKGAQLTVGNLVDTAGAFVDQLDLQPDDAFGTGLPLFHVFGQAVCLDTALVAGVPFSVLSPFEPVAMLEMIRDHRLTVVSGVPTMWNAMLHAKGDFGPADFAGLRLCASGGASLPGEVIRAFDERFGATILEGYGLTETSGAATYNPRDGEPRTGSVGVALPGWTIEVRDPAGTVLPAGEVGEVFVRGPSVMKGYWQRPEQTVETLEDGWLRTGDLGRMDADGYLYIVDRLKDLIIRGGYNVYPREVEEVLYEHPDVVEAAVIGVPDLHFGEEVALVVVGGQDVTIDLPGLRSWAKERLSAYKVPRLIAQVDELPKGATGKILKRALDWEALRAGAIQSWQAEAAR